MPTVAGIADAILALKRPHPVRVGIDGFCAAGKTTLGNALGAELANRGRSVIRACGDDFANPPELRHQLGKESPEGFYRHSVNVTALRAELLEPLGPGGSLLYRTTFYDVFASRPNLGPQLRADPSAVLLLDGLFIHAPELAGCFDFTIFVDMDFETCIARARTRRQERYDDPDAIEQLYRKRYVPGFRLYLDAVQPRSLASVCVTGG